MSLFCAPEAPKDLIRKLLVVDPKKRISIKEALDHCFFHTVVSILILYVLTDSSTFYNSQCKTRVNLVS